ncbi:MAG: disulfide isomerase, partial [Pseudomonadota bacterium]|nr:disulfide isomerase [Pseudomonadota bacterium]
LSFYSWDTDEQQLVPQSERAATLTRLASHAPAGEAALRLKLLALVALATSAPEDAVGTDNGAAASTLQSVFGDTTQAHLNADVLSNYSAKMVGFFSAPNSALRKRLQSSSERALARLAVDPTLSTTDQLAARDAQIAVAHLSAPSGPLAPTLLSAAQAQVAAASLHTTDVYERQSVISAAGDVLTDAGLLDQSDQLLTAELKRSHSPYYFMLGLAANAKKRHDTTTALHWYQAAYADAKGPATRLQWGTTYLNNLLELAPDDEKRIEQVATAVFGELAQTPDAFYERNRLRLEATAHKLASWKGQRHEAAFARLAAQLNGVCTKLPAGDAQRPTCLALLASA